MDAGPIDIVVLTDEPFHASYLATVLHLELPGLFRVRHAPLDRSGDDGGADLVLLQVEPGAMRDVHPLAHLAPAACRAPVIVVARGVPDLLAVGRLIQEGADDVIDLAHLNTRGLAAAVLKAVRRRGRSPLAALAHRESAAAAAF